MKLLPSLFAGAFFAAAGILSAQDPPPVITRPIEVWWGSYRNNEDLVGTNASQWTTVQQQMDGYLLHGAYWNYANNSIGSPSPDTVGPQLATILSNAGNKPVMVEALLAGEYADVNSAFGYGFAGAVTNAAGFGNGIANIRRLRNYGFNLRDVSTDYIMSTWERSVRFHPDWTPEEFFTAITGDWDGYEGNIFDTNTASADRSTYGWFRQWVERIAQAFPEIRVTAVNSPVYFPWYEGANVYRELGESECSYYTWLKIERRGTNYTAYYSGEGTGWQQLVSTNLDLGAAPRAGFFVASLTNREAEGRFDSVNVQPFFTRDIGVPGTPGSVTNFTTNTIALLASGNDGLHPGNPSRDAQFFAYREVSGNGTFTARLDALAGSNPARTNAGGELPTAGLTIRESDAANSRQVSLHGNAAKQIEFVARGTTGGQLTNVVSPVANQGAAPRWLRLVRSNNVMTALNSADGLTWITNGSVTLTNLAAKLLVGLAADSQVTFETATAQFSQIDLAGQAFPGSGFSGFTGTTIGAAGSASSSGSGGVFTLDAAGQGAAGSSDNLQYHHLAMTNDGTFHARLRYFADNAAPATALPSGAQLGLMLRGNTTASAPHLSVAFTPQQGLLTLARSVAGGTTVQLDQESAGVAGIQSFINGNYRPLLRYFTGNGYMEGLHGAFPGSYSNNFAGFTTDSPYAGYQAWGGSETQADAVRHRRKIILYEQWLQARGREHHFIANSTPTNNTSTQAGRDAWDLRYKQDSMRSIQLHQLEGGRPDKVIFESWYDGPFTMVPETKDGTFANLARDGLLYIKGNGQSLDLHAKIGAATNTNAWVSVGAVQTNASAASASPALSNAATAMGAPLVFTVRLTNTGTVPALPVLHAHETGGDGWSNSYILTSGAFTSNVTSGITNSGGQIVTDSALYSGNELIEANRAVDVTVTMTPTNAVRKRKVLLRAFWNPQDPGAQVRDAISLEAAPPSELVANGDFENGTTGWTATGGGIVAETSMVRSGSGAIRSTNRTATWNGPVQNILGRLVSGQTYRLAAWVRTDSSTASNVKATIAYTGTSGSAISTGVRTLNNVDNTGWKLVEGYYRFTEPNGPATVLRLYFEGPPAGVVLYVDDVGLTLASPVWTDTLPGSRSWTNTFSWQSGNAPVSFSGNAIAFFPSQTVSTGSMTAIQNIGNNFQLNSLTLGGLAPTNGAVASVGITSNSLAFTAHDGTVPSLRLEASGTNLSYAIGAPLVLTDNLVVNGSGTASFVLSSTVSGTGSLAKTGVATLTMVGSNSFVGGLALSDGSLVIGHDSAVGTGPLVLSGGALRAAAGSRIVTNAVSIAGGITLGGNLNFTGSLQLNGGNRTLTVETGGLAVAHGSVSDDAPRNLVKAGIGTLVLAASNSYRGVTAINEGVLRAADAHALGSSESLTQVAGGNALGTLEFSGGFVTTEPLKLAMHNTADHRQVRNISGHNELRGPLLLEGGGSRWDVASLAGTIEIAGVLSNTATSNDTWRYLDLHGPGAGVISGPTVDTRSAAAGSSLNLRVNSGIWTITGSGKAHQGTTTVAGGTLVLESELVSPVVVDNAATITGSGSTSTNFTINPGATVLRRLSDWNGFASALGAARFIGPGNSNWTIRIDGTGLAGFSEMDKTIPVLSGNLTNFSLNAINVAAVNFPGSGTWSIATNASSLSLQYSAASPDAFESWEAGIAWNGRPSGMLDDPDADGVPNLAEYAFGGDPLRSGDTGHPVVSLDGDRLKLTFRRVADPALIYEVLATEDPASPGSVIWSSSGAQNVDGPVTVTDTVGTQGRLKRFVRVRITR